MSVFVRQHDGQDPRDFPGIDWLSRTDERTGVVTVDLPKDALAGMFDAAEIMLAVRVVLLGEGVELANLFEDRGAIFAAQAKDAIRDGAFAVRRKAPPESVVTLADFRGGVGRRAGGFLAHGLFLSC